MATKASVRKIDWKRLKFRERENFRERITLKWKDTEREKHRDRERQTNIAMLRHNDTITSR